MGQERIYDRGPGWEAWKTEGLWPVNWGDTFFQENADRSCRLSRLEEETRIWSKADAVPAVLNNLDAGQKEKRQHLTNNLPPVLNSLQVNQEHNGLRVTVEADPVHQGNWTGAALGPNQLEPVHLDETFHDWSQFC